MPRDVRATLVGAGALTVLLAASWLVRLLVSTAHPRGLIDHAALGTGVWPSGHVTAAAAFALCLVIAAGDGQEFR
jgi:membrane-associated phospholipid phosphatase